MSPKKKTKGSKARSSADVQAVLREQEQGLLNIVTQISEVLEEKSAVETSEAVAVLELGPRVFSFLFASQGLLTIIPPDPTDPENPEDPLYTKFLSDLDNTFDKFETGGAATPAKCVKFFTEAMANHMRAWLAINASEKKGQISKKQADADRQQILNNMKTTSEELGKCFQIPLKKIKVASQAVQEDR